MRPSRGRSAAEEKREVMSVGESNLRHPSMAIGNTAGSDLSSPHDSGWRSMASKLSPIAGAVATLPLVTCTANISISIFRQLTGVHGRAESRYRGEHDRRCMSGL